MMMSSCNEKLKFKRKNIKKHNKDRPVLIRIFPGKTSRYGNKKKTQVKKIENKNRRSSSVQLWLSFYIKKKRKKTLKK